MPWPANSRGVQAWQQSMANLARRRESEKAFDRQVAFWKMQQEEQQAAQRRQNIWQEHRDIAQMFVQRYNGAQSAVERELIQQDFLAYSKAMPENMRRGVEMLTRNSPLSMQSISDRAWLERNKEPVMSPGLSPEEDPHQYAEVLWQKELHKRRFAKERRGEDYQPKRKFLLYGTTYAEVQDDGSFDLGDYKVDKEIERGGWDTAAQGTGLHPEQLKRQGGWISKGVSKMIQTNPETGSQHEILVSVEKNAMTGKTRTNKIGTSEIKRPQSERPDVAKNPPALPDKAELLSHYLRTDTKPDDEANPEMNYRWTQIKELSKRFANMYSKAKDESTKGDVLYKFEQELNQELSGLSDGRFTWVVIPGEEGNRFNVISPLLPDWVPFWPDKEIKIAEGARILPLPGRLSQMMTRDGKFVEVVVDQENNIVTDPSSGMFLGTVEQARMRIGELTLERLTGGMDPRDYLELRR